MTVTTAQIRTSDKAWAAKHGTPGTDGRTTVRMISPEPFTFCGKPWVRFMFDAPKPPRDTPTTSLWFSAPAAWCSPAFMAA